MNNIVGFYSSIFSVLVVVDQNTLVWLLCYVTKVLLTLLSYKNFLQNKFYKLNIGDSSLQASYQD